jgi:hypothetical protein
VIAVAVAALVFAQSPACEAPHGYESIVVASQVRAGDLFRVSFGGRYALRLEPIEFGWTIGVEQRGREENLARLTPPWHFVPNPRSIEGWHFRNALNTGPNDGSVNAPQERRDFIFSPEVGLSLDYDGSGTPPAVVGDVRRFGRGVLTVTDYTLTPIAEGERASFEEMSFTVCLVWRTADAM